MSASVITFFNRDQAPSRGALEDGAKLVGLDLRFDPEFELLTSRGFVPTSLGEMDAGFEHCLTTSAEIAEIYGDPQMLEAAAKYNSASEFIWHSSMEECAAAIAAAASLAAVVGGVIFDPDSGEWYSPEKAVEVAKQTIDSLED